MSDSNDNSGAGWTARNLTAPLSAMAAAAQIDATRQQVRLVASALGLEVSEFAASKYAETLLALVEAEKASGITTFAVTAHLLDSRAAAHNAAMIARIEKGNALTERIVVALEKLAGVKGNSEPAAKYSAQQVSDLRVVAGMIAKAKPSAPAAEWEHGTACVEMGADVLTVYLRAAALGEQGHRFLRILPEGLRHSDLMLWVAATCRAIATHAEGSAVTLDELVALELAGGRHGE